MTRVVCAGAAILFFYLFLRPRSKSPTTPVENENSIYAPLDVLIAGNFLSGAFSGAGGNWGVCEELAERLGAFGWAGGRDIARTGRVVRVIDILFKGLESRKSIYSVDRHFLGAGARVAARASSETLYPDIAWKFTGF